MAIDVIVSNGQDTITTYQEAIRTAGEKLVEKGNIDAKYIDACIEREIDFPTGLLLANGDGIAIPHGNSDLVNKDSISVVRIKNTVEFGRMEDKTSSIISLKNFIFFLLKSCIFSYFTKWKTDGKYHPSDFIQLI